MSEINHTNIEAWMFEYTEGNLSAEDSKELMQFIEQHPHYKEDLNSWTMAYMKAPLPKADLSKLFRPAPFLNYLLGIGLSIVFVVLLTWIYFSLNKPNAQSIKTKMRSSSIQVHETRIQEKSRNPEVNENVELLVKRPLKNRKKDVPVSSTPLVANTTHIVDTLFTEHASKDFILPSDPSTRMQEKDTPGIVKIEPLLTVPASQKALTKQQLKEMAKAKKKMLQRRKEQEFMKGNKPYVVPFSD